MGYEKELTNEQSKACGCRTLTYKEEHDFFGSSITTTETILCIECFKTKEFKCILDKISKIILDYDIDTNGFYFSGRNRYTIHNNFKIEYFNNILRCIDEIPLLYEQAKNYKRTMPSSYGAKHEIEHYREEQGTKNAYISNGEFIVAMIYLEFPFRREKDSANCQFKFKYKK